MSKLTWDGVGKKKYEYGVSHGVLYKKTGQTTGKEWEGVAWDGLTSVDESPEGAEANDFYADNQIYAKIRSAEKYGGTINAYTYPEEFESCNGEAQPVKGMVIGGQVREVFRLSYRIEQGDDEKHDRGYKIKLVYGATCSVSDQSHETVNDNPELDEMSWDFECVGVPMTNRKDVSIITIDSTDFVTQAEKDALAALEGALYGTENTEPYMPDPDAVKTLLTPAGTP